MLPSDNKKALARTRLNTAKERISYAKEILEIGDYKTVANRSYYAVFAAMRAVLALDGFDSKKHSGIIAEFRRTYIKTGVFPVELSDVIEELFNVRPESDYDDFFLLSKDEVTEQLKNAEIFVNCIEKYLEDKI